MISLVFPIMATSIVAFIWVIDQKEDKGKGKLVLEWLLFESILLVGFTALAFACILSMKAIDSIPAILINWTWIIVFVITLIAGIYLKAKNPSSYATALTRGTAWITGILVIFPVLNLLSGNL